MKAIDSFSRGLQVLNRLLSHSGAASLADLHRETRIPKPSLLALLETLRQAGVAVLIEGQGWTVANGYLLQVQTLALIRVQQRLHLFPANPEPNPCPRNPCPTPSTPAASSATAPPNPSRRSYRLKIIPILAPPKPPQS